MSFAAEEIYKDGGSITIPGGTGNGSNWLAYFNFNSSPSVSTWLCVSGEEVSDGGPRYVKYSIAPTYTVNANLSLRAQYSYTSYNNFAINSANFGGVEAIFHF